MTDRTDLLRGPAGLRGGYAVLAGAVAVFLAAVTTLLVGVSDPASADTVVTSVTQAVVHLPDGSEHEARIGELLPRGSSLRTGDLGGARVTTAGRDVWVGALSTLAVLDGVRQSLDRGQVMVDSRRGPRLEVGTRAGRVAVAAGSLARIERAEVLRLGVFDGSAALTAAGRQSTARVPALHQVLTQYGALPGRPTALALTPGDAWERRLAPGLVSNDALLNELRDGLRGVQGAQVLSAAPASLRSATGCDTERGERALSVAVAAVARAASPAASLGTVCTSRREGGSWGVVAAIVRSDVDAVAAGLGSTIDDLAPDDEQLAGGPVDLSGLFGPTAAPTTAPTSVPTGGPRPTGRPTTPTPTTSPTTSVVDDVVTIVTGVLPTPVAEPLLKLPSPTPAPLVSLGPITVGIG